MSGGLVNDAYVQPIYVVSAVSYAGTLLKRTTTAGRGDLCGAGEEPNGYAFTSSKDPVTKVATANVTIGIAKLVDGDLIEVPLLSTNAEIAVGDALETTASGTVDKLAGAGWQVGTAAEAKAATAGTGAFIKVYVNKKYVAS